MFCRLLFWLTALYLASTVCAQFNFFEQMFGNPGHQQQQQRPSGAGGAGQWMVQADSVSCSQYLCPATLVCVSNPSNCPCPDVQDIKCLIPDAQIKGGATVICVRGADGCAVVDRLAGKLV